MKFFNAILFIVILVFLTGCNLYSESTSYTIDDTKYVTGFYDELFTNSQTTKFAGDYYSNSDDIWDEKKVDVEGQTGYEITFSEFDMYSIIVNMWEFKIFVNENQIEDAKEYYHDMENFHYYVAYSYEAYEYDKYVEIKEEEMFDYYLKELNDYDGKSQLLEGINHETNQYFIYKISKDGLFTSLRNSYYIVDDQLYKFTRFDDDKYYGIIIEEDVSNYFIEIINKNLNND